MSAGMNPTPAAPSSTVEVAGPSSAVRGTVPSDQKGNAIQSTAPATPGVASTTLLPEEKDAVAAQPLSDLQELWTLARTNTYPEIWGVALADPDGHIPTQIVLQKYLNANEGDLARAKDQLLKTLNWRAQMKPLELLKKKFAGNKFGGLGFVTTYGADAADGSDAREIFTWNIYGGVRSIDETFGDLEDFLEWRVALMELALQSLSISSATHAITATEDPYKIVQVHDYKSISFLRQSPSVKSASQATIKVFAQNYPELLKEKFFVNVPAIMGFVYAFMKLFVAAKTIKKFHPMSNGSNLAQEFGNSKVKSLGDLLPEEYGGKGGDLKMTGKGPSLEKEMT